MKKLICFMFIMSPLTTQNALGQYSKCIDFTEWSDNIRRCAQHCKESGHGMRGPVYIHHSDKSSMIPEIRKEYERCVEGEKKVLCTCTQ